MYAANVFRIPRSCVHIYKSLFTNIRVVGSLKLQLSLENIGLFCRALLQKRPINNRGNIGSFSSFQSRLVLYTTFHVEIDVLCRLRVVGSLKL